MGEDGVLTAYLSNLNDFQALLWADQACPSMAVM